MRKDPSLQEPRPQAPGPRGVIWGSDLNLTKTQSWRSRGEAQGRTELIGLRPPPAAPATLGSEGWVAGLGCHLGVLRSCPRARPL